MLRVLADSRERRMMEYRLQMDEMQQMQLTLASSINDMRAAVEQQLQRTRQQQQQQRRSTSSQPAVSRDLSGAQSEQEERDEGASGTVHALSAPGAAHIDHATNNSPPPSSLASFSPSASLPSRASLSLASSLSPTSTSTSTSTSPAASTSNSHSRRKSPRKKGKALDERYVPVTSSAAPLPPQPH